MGKQTNFLTDEIIECEFASRFINDGCILFEGESPEPYRLNKLPDAYSSEGWFSVYFYNSDFGELVYKSLPDGKQYIDSIKSPVIEFIRTIVRREEREISRGRLWLEPKYWNDDNSVYEKPKELVLWFNEMSKWIKRNASQQSFTSFGYQYKEYISPSVMTLITEGYRIY